MELLTLRGVARTYPGPPPVHAIQDVDLTVAAGDYCAVTGPSGSGKSTLLNLLGLLDHPTAGTYQVAGQDVANLSAREVDRLRATTFGFVFQSAHMVGRWSVAANVALGLRAQRSPRSARGHAVAQALHLVSLEHRVTAAARHLSGGERQRAAVARAVCAQPQVLLADEPTGNLDSHNAAAVLDLFDQVHARGVTIVVITHDEQVAARAHRRVVVRDGRLTHTSQRPPTALPTPAEGP